MLFLSFHSFENVSTDEKLNNGVHGRLIIARDKGEVTHWKSVVAFHLQMSSTKKHWRLIMTVYSFVFSH